MTDTKEKIIETAMNLFWTRNYEAVGVDLICTEAGVKKGSFYHFFPSKSALALAVVELCWGLAEEHFYKPNFDTKFPPRERFERYLETIAKKSEECNNEDGKFCGCPIGNMASELSTENEEMQTRIKELFENWQNYYQGALEDALELGQLKDGVCPKDAARLILACVQGSVLLAKTGYPVKSINENIRTLIDSCFKS